MYKFVPSNLSSAMKLGSREPCNGWSSEYDGTKRAEMHRLLVILLKAQAWPEHATHRDLINGPGVAGKKASRRNNNIMGPRRNWNKRVLVILSRIQGVARTSISS